MQSQEIPTSLKKYLASVRLCDTDPVYIPYALCCREIYSRTNQQMNLFITTLVVNIMMINWMKELVVRMIIVTQSLHQSKVTK